MGQCPLVCSLAAGSQFPYGPTIFKFKITAFHCCCALPGLRANVSTWCSGTHVVNSNPISRSIVESHGGRLWATTHPGRGATFQFTLPSEARAHQVA
ncbi:MAG: hypothetical protein DMG61_22900 [Acidobacteria bacterium]|nr:MAG: hypothetical protein DMG61_22900 [Acidobacteriota bacterium]PYY20169.1 MAG: hypothetical protein DMG60_01155 [Acidobacteriota bacterium]